MKYQLVLALALASATSFAQTKKPATPVKKPVTTTAKPATPAGPVIKTQTDSASYAFGASIAEDLKSRGIKSLNYALLNKAMADVFASSKVALTPEQCQAAIMNLFDKVSKEKYASAIADNKKFLDENKTKAGIITTPSGLQYQVVQAGTGEKPGAADEVTVHYKGTLVNGNQFDSSYDRGEPIALTLNQVIPGWTEGIQLMPVGSKYKFFIPYQLGYGERGAGEDIPPYSTLIFDVELIKINKPETKQ